MGVPGEGTVGEISDFVKDVGDNVDKGVDVIGAYEFLARPEHGGETLMPGLDGKITAEEIQRRAFKAGGFPEEWYEVPKYDLPEVGWELAYNTRVLVSNDPLAIPGMIVSYFFGIDLYSKEVSGVSEQMRAVALANPDSSTARFVRALEQGDTKGAAREAALGQVQSVSPFGQTLYPDAIIRAGDAARAGDLMDLHLDSVAGRALLTHSGQRDVRSVLAGYAGNLKAV